MLSRIIKLEQPKKDTELLQHMLVFLYSVPSLPFKMNKISVMIWKPHLGKIIRVNIQAIRHQNVCWVAVGEASGKVQLELSTH